MRAQNSIARCCVCLVLFFAFSLPAFAQEISEQLNNPPALCANGVAAIQVDGASCDLCGDKSSTCIICPNCGDGCPGANEACDDGNIDQTDSCRDCRYPICGDGVSNEYDFNSHGETCEPVLDIDCRANCTKCGCLLYTSPSPRDATLSRMPSSA